MSIHSTQAMELLTVTEAAEFLKISVPTTRRLQLQRNIPFVKVAGCVRFLKSDLLAYIGKRRVEAIE
ncbi:MAG: helix-turn-helix domain-containing protein [Patescibacteria group bacterium]|nr:helix-turn-helix domain-containing protein [Patescibacteria group bacterium]